MNIETSTGVQINSSMVKNYFSNMVNQFFKILPMKENNEESLHVYMQTLQAELLGCSNLISGMEEDPMILTLTSILQYLIDTPDCSVMKVRREVFDAISICNKLRVKYVAIEEQK